MPPAVSASTSSAGRCRRRFARSPRTLLVGTLVIALENERLQIASSLRYATALVGELQAFRRQVTGAGRAAYGAETGAHDDLVVAVALGVWWGGRARS